jgi:hypothetical protein
MDVNRAQAFHPRRPAHVAAPAGPQSAFRITHRFGRPLGAGDSPASWKTSSASTAARIGFEYRYGILKAADRHPPPTTAPSVPAGARGQGQTEDFR